MRVQTTIFCLLGGAALGACSLLTDLGGLSGGGKGGAGGDGAGGEGGVTSSSSSSSVTTSASSGGGEGGGGGGGSDIGCSDGTREAYVDVAMQPDIAGCAGAFSIQGIVTQASFSPACDRMAGNDGANPSGMGCSVEDLCAEGWHVCSSAEEVERASATGACPSFQGGGELSFWLTRQSQNANSVCVASGINNVVGCGYGFGNPLANGAGCTPLNRMMNAAACSNSGVWNCPDTMSEATVIRKNGALGGGVLCCRG